MSQFPRAQSAFLPLPEIEQPGVLVEKEDSESQDLKGFGMAEAGARKLTL